MKKKISQKIFLLKLKYKTLGNSIKILTSNLELMEKFLDKKENMFYKEIEELKKKVKNLKFKLIYKKINLLTKEIEHLSSKNYDDLPENDTFNIKINEYMEKINMFSKIWYELNEKKQILENKLNINKNYLKNKLIINETETEFLHNNTFQQVNTTNIEKQPQNLEQTNQTNINTIFNFEEPQPSTSGLTNFYLNNFNNENKKRKFEDYTIEEEFLHKINPNNFLIKEKNENKKRKFEEYEKTDYLEL